MNIKMHTFGSSKLDQKRALNTVKDSVSGKHYGQTVIDQRRVEKTEKSRKDYKIFK